VQHRLALVFGQAGENFVKLLWHRAGLRRVLLRTMSSLYARRRYRTTHHRYSSRTKKTPRLARFRKRTWATQGKRL
jgi:hypothetical protein